jgi:hypothetical protein
MMIGEFDMTSCETSGAVPARMSVGVRWDGDASGALALMLALIADAVHAIEQGRRCRGSRARRLSAEAEAWVRSNCRDWPFSFLNACQVLGLDAHAFRTRLFTMRNDASGGGRGRVRAPIPLRAMALALDVRRVATGGTR